MALRTTLRIAWRSLWRNRKRAILALTAIGVGQFAYLATAAIMHGYGEDFFDSITGPLVGHIQIHAPGWRNDRSIDQALTDLAATLAMLRADAEVEDASPRIYAPALVAEGTDGFMGMVVGVDPVAESSANGLFAGNDYSAQIGDGRVLVGRAFATKNGIEPGDELAVVGQDADGSIANDLYRVSVVIPSAVELVHNLGIVMTLEDAQDLLYMPDQAHEIILHLRDREQLDQTLERVVNLETLASAEVIPWHEVVPLLVNMIDIIDAYLYIILFIVLIAAAAGIANTMLMSTFERTHEYGMLLSLGCGPGRLSLLVAAEATVLGQIGVLVGTALGLGFALLTAQTGLDYAALGGSEAGYETAFKGLQLSSMVFPKLYARDVITGALAVFLTSMVSVVWPMFHIARLEPMEAMRT